LLLSSIKSQKTLLDKNNIKKNINNNVSNKNDLKLEENENKFRKTIKTSNSNLNKLNINNSNETKSQVDEKKNKNLRILNTNKGQNSMSNIKRNKTLNNLNTIKAEFNKIEKIKKTLFSNYDLNHEKIKYRSSQPIINSKEEDKNLKKDSDLMIDDSSDIIQKDFIEPITLNHSKSFSFLDYKSKINEPIKKIKMRNLSFDNRYIKKNKLHILKLFKKNYYNQRTNSQENKDIKNILKQDTINEKPKFYNSSKNINTKNFNKTIKPFHQNEKDKKIKNIHNSDSKTVSKMNNKENNDLSLGGKEHDVKSYDQKLDKQIKSYKADFSKTFSSNNISYSSKKFSEINKQTNKIEKDNNNIIEKPFNSTKEDTKIYNKNTLESQSSIKSINSHSDSKITLNEGVNPFSLKNTFKQRENEIYSIDENEENLGTNTLVNKKF